MNIIRIAVDPVPRYYGSLAVDLDHEIRITHPTWISQTEPVIFNEIERKLHIPVLDIDLASKIRLGDFSDGFVRGWLAAQDK